MEPSALRPGRRRALAALLAAACAPTPGLRAGLGGAGPGGRRPPGDEDLLALVPSDAETILSIDLAALRGSPWTRPVFASRPAPGPGARGFDEIADVDWLVLAKIARAGAAAPSLELMRGRFDRARVAAAFGGTSGIENLLGRGGEALAFLSDRTVAAGPAAAVRAALEVASGAAGAVAEARWYAEAQAALEDEFGRHRGRPAVELALAVTEETRAALRKELGGGEALERAAGRVELGGSLGASFVGLVGSRHEARALETVVRRELRRAHRGAAGLGLGLIFDRLAFETRGARLVASLKLSDADREGLGEGLEALGKALATPRGGGSGTEGAPPSVR